jgi:hypothetical protein
MFQYAAANGVSTGGPQPRFGRLDDTTLSTQSLHTGDTITITGNITIMTQEHLTGKLSVHSDPGSHGRWEVISKEPVGNLVDMPGNSEIPYSLTVKALQPGSYHLCSEIYLVGIGLFSNPNNCNTESVIVTGEPICTTGFVAILKAEDNSSACIKPESVSKLLIRGWAILNLKDFGYNPGRGPVTFESTNNYTGIETIKNQTYNFTILNDTTINYIGEPPKQMLFHDVVFTFFPHGFSGGPPGSCGVTSFGSDLKFSDDIHELLGVGVPGMPCGKNYAEIELSKHTNPQAGLAVHDGKIKLLVSRDNQSSPALRLYLSLDSTDINPAEPLGVDLSLNNTSSKPLILTN